MNRDRSPLKAVLYARSNRHDEQERQRDLDLQVIVGKRIAKLLKVSVVEVCFDYASAYSGHRHGYERMLWLVRRGRANTIIAKNFETLSRSVTESVRLSRWITNGRLCALYTHSSPLQSYQSHTSHLTAMKAPLVVQELPDLSEK